VAILESVARSKCRYTPADNRTAQNGNGGSTQPPHVGDADHPGVGVWPARGPESLTASGRKLLAQLISILDRIAFKDVLVKPSETHASASGTFLPPQADETDVLGDSPTLIRR